MSSFVVNANLPCNAETVILGKKYAGILQKPLIKCGVSPLFVPDNPDVDKRLSGHADLSVFFAGGEWILLAPFLKGSQFAKTLDEMGLMIAFADIAQHEKYPFDAQLNAFYVGTRLIYNKKVTAREIVEKLTNDGGVRFLSGRQGYAGCSVCGVDENSIITSDAGIAALCSADGMDVLKICPGTFALDGFESGFIGGCTCKLSADKLAFTGRIDDHPDKDKIFSFLESHGVDAVFLTDFPAFDIGGAIPITEKTA